MRRLYMRAMLLVGITLFLISCATKEQPAQRQEVTKIQEVKKNALRIGITPDYPPMAFKLNGKISGVEADFAKALAKELNRSGEFIELSWEDQIPALMEGTIDIIMSGMTITDARRVRINFTDHYMKSGLLTLIRAQDAAKYASLEAIKTTKSNVGVISGTTGESYVRKNFPHARVVVLAKPSDAPVSFRNTRIDLFINDAPSIIWLASENVSELRGFWKPLDQEYIGWGVRQDDGELLTQVNSVLARWKKDGTLRDVLLRWLPYLKRPDLAGLIG